MEPNNWRRSTTNTVESVKCRRCWTAWQNAGIRVRPQIEALHFHLFPSLLAPYLTISLKWRQLQMRNEKMLFELDLYIIRTPKKDSHSNAHTLPTFSPPPQLFHFFSNFFYNSFSLLSLCEYLRYPPYQGFKNHLSLNSHFLDLHRWE